MRPHSLVDHRSPVGHMFKQGVERYDIKLSDVGRKSRCIGHNAAEYFVIAETVAKSRARNELRVEVDAGDQGAPRDPVHTPRSRAAPHVENAKRCALRQQALEAFVFATELPGIARGADCDWVARQIVGPLLVST